MKPTSSAESGNSEQKRKSNTPSKCQLVNDKDGTFLNLELEAYLLAIQMMDLNIGI